MNILLSTLIPLVSSIISFTFAFFVFKRYQNRKGAYLLLWSIGLVFYGIGGFCEFYYGAFGWNPLLIVQRHGYSYRHSLLGLFTAWRIIP